MWGAAFRAAPFLFVGLIESFGERDEAVPIQILAKSGVTGEEREWGEIVAFFVGPQDFESLFALRGPEDAHAEEVEARALLVGGDGEGFIEQG